MQAELMYRKPSSSAMTTSSRQDVSPSTSQQEVFRGQRGPRDPRNPGPMSKDSRETIHSGHFMVSDFEAEAQDDEDELAVPVPEEEAARMAIIAPTRALDPANGARNNEKTSSQQLSIETSLNKLFQCMSLAYRQKLTSPKWNRFKGIRLRWKDKIRLNNVIWRCWHMQFILKQNTLVCQFASPLDVDTHNKPEAVVLEGKYWKRKLAAVTAEYKKWRMFYRNKILGWTPKDGQEMLECMDMLEWGSGSGGAGNFATGSGNSYSGSSGTPGGDSMMVDEDYMELMTDTLFSTISSNQPIYFPDPREIARGASLADFIQPSLGPLQPNLDDFMDTLEPLQEFLNSKLPAVPEEEDMFRGGTLNQTYPELDLMAPMQQMNELSEDSLAKGNEQQQQSTGPLQGLQYTGKIFSQPQTETPTTFTGNTNLGENYAAIRANFQSQGTTQTVVEKPRQSRSSTRTNRVIQQRQQQPNTYPTTFPQQQQPPYAMEIQTAVEMSALQSQQVPALNEQQNNNNSSQPSQLNPMTTQLQNLVSLPTTFTQIQQKPVVRQAPQNHTVLAGKPFKVVQPQRGYKFPQAQNFGPQQCKFNANNFKPLTGQQVVDSQSSQQILLQCRPGLDLSGSKLQPEKEEVFAVPKYQMKQRNRSRSSSSLSAARIHPPPLVSTVSDPALNLNNNVLLAHLLTNNTSGIYAMSTSSEKIVQSPSQQQGNVKHMLPMLPPSTTATGHHLPSSVPSLQTSTVHGQSQQGSCGQQMMLNQPTGQTHQPQGSPGSPKGGNSPQGLNLSPLHSPMSIGSPLSPGRAFVKAEAERGQYKEQRRVGHIHAEQKRRYNIKNGFDMLHSLIPQLSQNPNTKLSKAAMLQKGADYIRQLRAERNQLKEEMDSLRHQIECLNTSIRHRTSKMKEMFDEYVRARTQENWKFWIFSILLEPLMVSFNSSVSTASIEDLYRSTILWVEQHCSLVDLRPAVLNSLRYLSTATDILSDPARLPEEALAAVNRKERRRSTQ